MQDPTGRALGGMHHDDAPLPSFVFHGDIALATTGLRAKGDPMAAHASADLSAVAAPAREEPTQRMETPVIYLHTAHKLTATVRVTFPFGLMTQWYPNCTEVLPTAPAVEQVAGGSLTWQVDIDPQLDAKLAPAVAPGSIWAPSRQVQVPSLRAREPVPGTAVARAPTSQVEKFLFYRGVGKFDTPIVVQSHDPATLTITNLAQEPVAAAFLLRVVDAGHATVLKLGGLPGRTSVQVPVPTALQPMAVYLQAARPAIAQALQASGLYADEAWALVNTWDHSYFQTPGLRVLFVLPQAWTEALLPLSVSPRPVQTVRTLIGRIEVLTGAHLAQLTAQVAAAFANVGPPNASGYSAQATAGLQLVAALQPYAEAKLFAVCDQMASGAAKQACLQARAMAHQGW